MTYSSGNSSSRSSFVRLRRIAGRWGASFAALALLLGPAVASANSVSFDLTVEFDDDLIGDYGEVTIEEVDGGLNFSIVLNDPLGPDPDLHEFYFDWQDAAVLQITTLDDATTTLYSLEADPPVAGGAGASFDYGVNFGNGGGPKGNGRPSSASFRLELASGGLLDLEMLGDDFAAHVQNTALVEGADSETVGGTVPEAATGALVALGLVALSSLSPRRLPGNRSAAMRRGPKRG
jgi:hypothetical protein